MLSDGEQQTCFVFNWSSARGKGSIKTSCARIAGLEIYLMSLRGMETHFTLLCIVKGYNRLC